MTYKSTEKSISKKQNKFPFDKINNTPKKKNVKSIQMILTNAIMETIPSFFMGGAVA